MSNPDRQLELWDDEHLLAPGDGVPERLLGEVNLLRLEHFLFCFDPNAAKRQTGRLELDPLRCGVAVELGPILGRSDGEARPATKARWAGTSFAGTPPTWPLASIALVSPRPTSAAPSQGV